MRHGLQSNTHVFKTSSTCFCSEFLSSFKSNSPLIPFVHLFKIFFNLKSFSLCTENLIHFIDFSFFSWNFFISFLFFTTRKFHSKESYAFQIYIFLWHYIIFIYYYHIATSPNNRILFSQVFFVIFSVFFSRVFCQDYLALFRTFTFLFGIFILF